MQNSLIGTSKAVFLSSLQFCKKLCQTRPGLNALGRVVEIPVHDIPLTDASWSDVEQEGNSVLSTARTADVSKNTVIKLLVDAGKACNSYQDRALQNLSCKRIQVDEIWSFVYAKQGNLPRTKQAPKEAGDVWTWTAMCADTKLVPSWTF